MSARVMTFLTGLVLVVAVLVCIWAKFRPEPEEQWQRFVQRLPLEVDGWVGEDVPLGPNEAAVRAVGKLNYEDYIYRVYRKGGIEVFVYAMYWSQGRISVREMAGHTPDGCWIANGARYAGPKIRHALLIDGVPTVPAESRTFLFPSVDARVNVVWWHIWGDDYVDTWFFRKSILTVVRETWIWLVERRGKVRDQMLVRVHSCEDLDGMEEMPPVKLFLSGVPQVFTAKDLR